jgi:hypothetical protein
MQGDRLIGTLGSLRRQLKALAAIAEDVGATAAERENAAVLKKRLEDRLRAAEARIPAGDWTEHAFRLGRWAKKVRQTASPAVGKGDWTENAYRLGKAARRGYKKLFSD